MPKGEKDPRNICPYHDKRKGCEVRGKNQSCLTEEELIDRTAAALQRRDQQVNVCAARVTGSDGRDFRQHLRELEGYETSTGFIVKRRPKNR